MQRLFNYLISGTPKSQVVLGLIASLLMTPLIFMIASYRSDDTVKQPQKKDVVVYEIKTDNSDQLIRIIKTLEKENTNAR